jgi:hypothetical protein
MSKECVIDLLVGRAVLVVCELQECMGCQVVGFWKEYEKSNFRGRSKYR